MNPQPPPRQTDVESLYAWQKTRQRADGAFAHPMNGFGPGGRLTLWLPAAKPSASWRIREGKPVLVAVEAEIDPETERLRQAVLQTSSNIGPGVIGLEPAFYEYAAHQIRRNYNVSDTDLEFALFTGLREWQRPMLEHVMGGADMVAALAGAADARAMGVGSGLMAYHVRAVEDADKAIRAAEAAPPAPPGVAKMIHDPVWVRFHAAVKRFFSRR